MQHQNVKIKDKPAEFLRALSPGKDVNLNGAINALADNAESMVAALSVKLEPVQQDALAEFMNVTQRRALRDPSRAAGQLCHEYLKNPDYHDHCNAIGANIPALSAELSELQPAALVATLMAAAVRNRL